MPGQMPARLREAAKLGFKTAIVPKRLRKGEAWPTDIEVVEARSVQQALELALGISALAPLGGVDLGRAREGHAARGAPRWPD